MCDRTHLEHVADSVESCEHLNCVNSLRSNVSRVLAPLADTGKHTGSGDPWHTWQSRLDCWQVLHTCAALSMTFRPDGWPAISLTAARKAPELVENCIEDTVTAPAEQEKADS